ncbi:hypothetical protein BC829DRAFT_490501 [Chytridium lagenaria]|nr:hypothetical protein BC829DRAFT_490501 [Chytridium lagenaria]
MNVRITTFLNHALALGWDCANLADAMTRAKVLSTISKDSEMKVKPLPSICYPDYIATNQEDSADNSMPVLKFPHSLKIIPGVNAITDNLLAYISAIIIVKFYPSVLNLCPLYFLPSLWIGYEPLAHALLDAQLDVILAIIGCSCADGEDGGGADNTAGHDEDTDDSDGIEINKTGGFVGPERVKAIMAAHARRFQPESTGQDVGLGGGISCTGNVGDGGVVGLDGGRIERRCGRREGDDEGAVRRWLDGLDFLEEVGEFVGGVTGGGMPEVLDELFRPRTLEKVTALYREYYGVTGLYV